MSVSGPSPLGTLMVQRVEAALGTTLAQQANIATGARPDAVTQPGQPDKVDPTKNPPPKEQEGARRGADQGGRQGGLSALARNDPEVARLLAARNAPMTSYTASAPTSLGQAAKTILALLQQFPDARPAVTGRAPLLGQAPGQGGSSATGGTGGAVGQAGAAGSGLGGPAAAPVGGQLDPRAVQALTQQGNQGGTQTGAAGAGANASPGAAGTAGAGAAAAAGANHAATGAGSSTALGNANTAAAQATAAGAATQTGALPAQPGMAGQLAMALAHAMQGSGLFYESHLRDLAFGRRTLAQLRAEPQAQAGMNPGGAAGPESAQARGADAGTASGQAAAQGQAASTQGHSGAQAAAAGAQAGAAGAQAGTQGGLHLAGALLGMDPSTHALVRQQLETLATQSFAWQGEAWPGSELDWEVQRREGGTDQETDGWATRLKLSLPGLGEVQARLSLSGSRLAMHLVSPDGAPLMESHAAALRSRLDAQGLMLEQLSISREPTEGRSEASRSEASRSEANLSEVSGGPSAPGGEETDGHQTDGQQTDDAQAAGDPGQETGEPT